MSAPGFCRDCLADAPHGTRCPACGSPLAMIYRGDAEVSVTLGSLDAPDLVEVSANIFTAERMPLADGFDRRLPDHAAFEPADETAGG